MTLILALSFAAPASQFATERSVEELAQESQAVVQGTVTETATRRTLGGLVTRYTIQTDVCLLGPCKTKVSVLLPGGRAEGLEQRVADVPLWNEGDQVVVFVPPSGDPVRLQGVFTVEGDELVDPVARPLELVPQYVPGLQERLASVQR